MRSHTFRLLSLVIPLALAGCAQEVPAPKQFKEYSSAEFKCEYPADWETEGGGGTRSEYSMVKFTKGSAEIRAESDVAGSLMVEGARDDGHGEPRVAKTHRLKTDRMDEEFTNYKEREPKPFQSKGLGEGRKAIFVADGGMGGKIYGYHATLLTNDKRLTIICQCPATNWKTLKPAFNRVIESFGR